MLAVLDSFAIVPVLFGLIASFYLAFTKAKSKVPDDDPTYLGFQAVIMLPLLFGIGIWFITGEGLGKVIQGALLVWMLFDLYRFTAGYIKAKLARRSQAKQDSSNP